MWKQRAGAWRDLEDAWEKPQLAGDELEVAGVCPGPTGGSS